MYFKYISAYLLLDLFFTHFAIFTDFQTHPLKKLGNDLDVCVFNEICAHKSHKLHINLN